MLVFDGRKILDSQVIHLVDFLQEGDVLVFNDAKVIKAKLSAKILRNSAMLDFNLDQCLGGFVVEKQFQVWSAICRPAKKVRLGDSLQIAEDFFAEVIEKTEDGFIKIRFDCDEQELALKLDKYGFTPLPPYIKRLEENQDDAKNYQTVYAASGQAVAAPTAGLHFNEKVFEILEVKKIKKVFVTLNVGAGTFLPVRERLVRDHKMHRESFSISRESAEIINQAKLQGKKVIAIGTTALRVLESTVDQKCLVRPIKSSTEIFIHPPYQFKIVDILMTNFHLPKSTLFMLVCAFLGKEKAFEIYRHAISKNYRFYSFGDSSLLFRQV